MDLANDNGAFFGPKLTSINGVAVALRREVVHGPAVDLSELPFQNEFGNLVLKAQDILAKLYFLKCVLVHQYISGGFNCPLVGFRGKVGAGATLSASGGLTVFGCLGVLRTLIFLIPRGLGILTIVFSLIIRKAHFLGSGPY